MTAGLVVVTGAGGHLGGNLVRELLAAGRRVRAVYRGRTPALEGLDVERCRADVRDLGAVRSALNGADIVYHLAAIISITGDPTGEVWATNVGGVANVAQAALEAGVRRVVHCSSVHAFDLERCRDMADETSPRSVRSELPAYDRSKAAGEEELRRWVAKGLDAVVVNPTGVIGPYDFQPSRVGRFFLALRRARIRAVVDGAFDWVDVRDVAKTMVAAAERGRAAESYIVGGTRVSLNEFADIAARVTGDRAPKVVVPMPVARLAAWALSFRHFSADSSPLFTSEGLHALRTCPHVSSKKAVLELGHRSRPTEETVADIYSWFDRHQPGQLQVPAGE